MQSPPPPLSMPTDAFGGVAWRSSSHSQGGGGECVELASAPGIIGVRDSKNTAGPALTFGRKVFRRFAAKVKDGSFDL